MIGYAVGDEESGLPKRVAAIRLATKGMLMSGSIVVADEGAAEALTVPEKRRAQIIETAIRLFSEHGYFQTTIDDIANAIPISKGLVYKYFKDKK